MDTPVVYRRAAEADDVLRMMPRPAMLDVAKARRVLGYGPVLARARRWPSRWRGPPRPDPAARVRSNTMRRRRFWSEGSTVPDTRGQTTIVLPTYNRAAFLPDAFAAIERRQTTHGTSLSLTTAARMTPVHRGGIRASARGADAVHLTVESGRVRCEEHGLALASGEFVAFYDSDDSGCRTTSRSAQARCAGTPTSTGSTARAVSSTTEQER